MSLVSQMTYQNPWWAEKEKIYEDKEIKRVKSSPYIIPPLRENILLLGPRQVGKTTFLKTTIMKLIMEEGIDPKKILFFTCDSLSEKKDLIQLISEYRNLINPKGGVILLDEVTFVKDWNVGLLHLFNAGYLEDTLVYVTGSASVNLLKETLPGRPIKKVVFYPLNFRTYFNIYFKKLQVKEVKDLKDVKSLYESAKTLIPYINNLNIAFRRYIERGGYFSTNSVEDPMELYPVYRDAIVSDIARLGKDVEYFKEIMRQVIEKYATRVAENTIARELSIGSHNTIGAYLELSEKLFILSVFKKIENDKFVERSFKKVYLIDPFLYRVMKLYTLGSDYTSEEIPKIVEGIVGEHLRREFKQVGYTFFKNGKEVDFIVNNVGIEVKWGKGNVKDLKVDKGYILTKDDIGIEGEKALIPVSVFLYLVSSEKVFYNNAPRMLS